jgi:prepilin-type N-terminal cleavage/methylation domain-containing protein
MSNPKCHVSRIGGFTLVELLVVISIIALLMGILLPALSRAREIGKRAVCQNQMKQLAIAWYMYCDDNSEKLPYGNIWYSWSDYWNYGGMQRKGPCFVEPVHVQPHSMPMTQATQQNQAFTAGHPNLADWQHAIAEGTIWKYVKDYKIYKCPVADKGKESTYQMSESLAGDPPSNNPNFTLRTQMKRTAEMFVFLDVADAGSGAFWLEYANAGLHWGDPPPTRHGVGTDFVFADQHVEYRKWTDPHTLWVIKNYSFNSTAAAYIDNCDCDLRWINKITWGNVNPSYNCTSGKKCDY